MIGFFIGSIKSVFTTVDLFLFRGFVNFVSFFSLILIFSTLSSPFFVVLFIFLALKGFSLGSKILLERFLFKLIFGFF